MKISKVVETDMGTARFEGELSAEELDYVIQAGLNTLLVMGAIKTKVVVQESDEEIPEGTQLQ